MAGKRNSLAPDTSGNSAGRIEVDSRGRNVWQWNDSQLDSTTILLRRLDNDALELESTGYLQDQSGGTHDEKGTSQRKTGADRFDSVQTESDAALAAETTLVIEATLTIETTMAIDTTLGIDTAWAIDTTSTVNTAGGFDPYNSS